MWLLILVLCLTSTNSYPCDEATSVDISSGIVIPGGNIVHNGLEYTPSQYYYEDNSTSSRRGCICQVKTCLRKCCPLGLHWNRVLRICSYGEKSFAAPVREHGNDLRYNSEDFNIVFGRQDCSKHNRIRARATATKSIFYLEKSDGMLYLKMPHALFPWQKLTVEEYCLDTFVSKTPDNQTLVQLDALVCFPEDAANENNDISMIGMFISTVFLLLTLAVYVFVPELRNMHGRVLMAYLASLLVGFLFLASLQLIVSNGTQTNMICLSFTFIVYFSLLAAFFWLNVMCFDIWWTFSGYRGMTRVHRFARRRYVAYSLYAFGFPTALTVLLAAMEFSDNVPEYIVTPKLRGQGCFIHGDGRLIYLYCPMLILSIANTIFFIATAIRIAMVRRQTSVLKGGDSSTHDQYRKDKQRLFLYVKLFVVMGLNWALEVISALYPEVPILWKITDAYNVLMGLTIFIIFICKKKIFRLIKKRYNVVVHGAPTSRSQTCSTRNASSISRDEIRLPPLTKP